MNLRRIVMASGSQIWKRACTTLAALPSAVSYTSITAPTRELDFPAMRQEVYTRNKKRMMFVELLNSHKGSVKETIDEWKSNYEEGKKRGKYKQHVSFTEIDKTSILEDKRQLDLPAMRQEVYTRNKKRMMFVELLNSHKGSVKATLDEWKNNYEEEKKRGKFKQHVSVTKSDLFQWAKRLNKQCKHQHAVEIFEWMESKNMSFTPQQLAVYVGLIAKTEDVYKAFDYFYNVDPNFNEMDSNAKNWPAYRKLRRLHKEHLENKGTFNLAFVARARYLK